MEDITWTGKPRAPSQGRNSHSISLIFTMVMYQITAPKVSRIHLRKFTTCYSEKISVATNHFHRILGHKLYYIGISSILSDWNPSYTIESNRLRLDSVTLIIFIMDGLDPTPTEYKIESFPDFWRAMEPLRRENLMFFDVRRWWQSMWTGSLNYKQIFPIKY